MNEGERSAGKEFFDWEWFQDSAVFPDNIWKNAIRNGPGRMPWVEQYVQEILSHVMPPKFSEKINPFPQQNSPHTKVQVFDTHHFLIARMPIPEQAELAGLRILVGYNRLLIKGLPDEEEKSVVLPSCVRADKCRAILKNRVLEVRMAKVEEDHLLELPIRVL